MLNAPAALITASIGVFAGTVKFKVTSTSFATSKVSSGRLRLKNSSYSNVSSSSSAKITTNESNVSLFNAKSTLSILNGSP